MDSERLSLLMSPTVGGNVGLKMAPAQTGITQTHRTEVIEQSRLNASSIGRQGNCFTSTKQAKMDN